MILWSLITNIHKQYSVYLFTIPNLKVENCLLGIWTRDHPFTMRKSWRSNPLCCSARICISLTLVAILRHKFMTLIKFSGFLWHFHPLQVSSDPGFRIFGRKDWRNSLPTLQLQKDANFGAAFEKSQIAKLQSDWIPCNIPVWSLLCLPWKVILLNQCSLFHIHTPMLYSLHKTLMVCA